MSRTSSRKPSTPTASTSAKLWMLMVSGVASKPPLPSQLPPLSSTWMMTETRCRFERRETRSSVGLQGFPMAGLPRIRAAPSWERQASHTTSRGAYLEWKNGLVLVRSAGRREACTLERASASWSVFSDCMILLYFWVFCGERAVADGVPSASKAEQNGYEDGQCRNSADIRDGDTKINEDGDHFPPFESWSYSLHKSLMDKVGRGGI